MKHQTVSHFYEVLTLYLIGQLLGSSNSAANKDMSNIWTDWDTNT